MVNYNNCKIYKIISANTDKIYIGSTCKKYLSARFADHASAYRNPLHYKNYSSVELFKLGDCKIVLLEAYPCNTKDELKAKEQDWLDTHSKDLLVNKLRANGNSKSTIYYRNNPEKYKKMVKSIGERMKIKRANYSS